MSGQDLERQQRNNMSVLMDRTFAIMDMEVIICVVQEM